MQWGITTLIGHRSSLDNFCRQVRDIGYQAVELNCVRDYYAHYNAMQLADSPAELLRVNEMLQNCGLKCSAVDCHGLFGRSMEEFDYSCDYLQAGMKVARALDCSVVVTSVPGSPAPQESIINRSRELCRQALDLGLEIAIEAEYGFRIGTPEELERFLNDVDMPNLKVNFDPFHFAAGGHDVAGTVKRFFPEITHVHLKECLPQKEHPTTYEGDPASPCSVMLDELYRLGYKGTASAETTAEIEYKTTNAAETVMKGIRLWQTSKGEK